MPSSARVAALAALPGVVRSDNVLVPGVTFIDEKFCTTNIPSSHVENSIRLQVRDQPERTEYRRALNADYWLQLQIS